MKETRVVIEVGLVKIIFLGVLFGVLAALAMGRVRAEGLPPGVTCDDVRNAVATVAKQTGKRTTEAALVVEAMALSGGATRQQVEAARRCLSRD